jgi:hypothetical protein
MDYKTQPPATKKTLEPVVHVLGVDANQTPNKGNTVSTGPQPAETFPDTDTYQGKPVDANYGTIPTDKDAIEANLRKVGQENITRFGLDERGVPDADKAPSK